MSKEIILDIQESIEKNLPSQVGTALKKRLKKIESLESQNEELSSELSKTKNEVNKLKADLARHKSLDNIREELEEREKLIEERERKMGIHDAELRAEEAEKRAELSKEYVTMVFRSPVYRQNISGYTAPRDHGGGFDKTTTEVVE